MMIKVRESTMVRPAQDTPHKVLRSSNIDLLQRDISVSTVYFYRPDGSSNFFDAKVLKEALSKVLVAFYPWAGRLRSDDNGRTDINCNGEGVLFVEAETGLVLDDLGDFMPSIELKSLIPAIGGYSDDDPSHPILVLQVTHFKCGGVCLGVGLHHILADGIASLHFINSWSEVARGIDVSLPPFIDRTPLRAREPPTPKFDHDMEFRLPILSKGKQTPAAENPYTIAMLKMTRDQLNILKAKANSSSNSKEELNTRRNYTTFEVLSGHLWRSVCKARGYPEDLETKIFIPVDGRSRLRHSPPPGYLGNVIFPANPIAIAGELTKNPLSYAAGIIHDTMMRMDDDYLRSMIDYFELNPDLNLKTIPTLTPICINSWARLPIYDPDFGWGRSIYMGLSFLNFDGFMIIRPSPTDDGSFSVAICLQSQHMELFKKVFYEF